MQLFFCSYLILDPASTKHIFAEQIFGKVIREFGVQSCVTPHCAQDALAMRTTIHAMATLKQRSLLMALLPRHVTQ
ncbi:hypothetical protein D8B23_13900 [Verminephrobacter aporrectodeae subsp. tuberculatae]|nr:hypothetical protein [Verminephrobacter aporrectodeae subsp. tuberculatae]MCW5290241.1 hypothetical protein [Verminephrobacter aporrectodeae subsp. tuberculatae]MCW8166498.1 hypothetical protein [Verminephrobacter aporrectodeae subsp. tuberculatae]MCW8170679.1 hypothetical protein [Verminephrobacter aporrectodeae subsp. tuberculatae]MCW8199484.1 hypothetical protein [Verminephrobacter aporrectodeae subsp. tuberculatae]